jgi:hypothetical protein
MSNRRGRLSVRTRIMGIMFGGRRSISAVLLGMMALAWIAPAARACSIPVFRYALEHWSPSTYEILVFTKGEIGDPERAILDKLTRRPANVEIRTVDVSAAENMSPEVAAIWKNQQPRAQLPWAVIRYPESGEDAPLVWAGKLTDQAALAQQLESPARHEITRRLLAGETCVWVLLESGERAKDDRLAAKLDETLKRVATTIKLPEIAPDGPQLRSPLPLNVSFSILRVSRSDPREAALVKMLRVAEPELADSDDALVIPVVGRGRAISALASPRVNDQGVGAFAEFICGQCSCEVKELNPGIDLLLAADWDVIFEDRRQGDEATGVVEGGKSVPIPVSNSAAAATPARSRDEVMAAGTSVAVAPRSYSLGRKWLIGAIFVVAATVLVSGAMALRARRGNGR